MNPILKNILAVIVGIIVGSILNSAIISISGTIISPPEGVDLTTVEGLQAAMPLMEPKHFIMPFLAHALGTFVGAFFACMIAATHQMKFALAIGILFLIGGIMMVYMVPSPTWFTALDLIVAYIPMAYIGGNLALKKK